MTLEEFEGARFIVLTPDDPAFPAVAIEANSELSQQSLAWNIHRMSSNVVYVNKPRELDPKKVIARLNGEIPPNSDVSKE